MLLNNAKAISRNYQHWIWITSEEKKNAAFRNLYSEYFHSNVYGVFFEFDDEAHYSAARQKHLKPTDGFGH
jgi:hypothetical protein